MYFVLHITKVNGQLANEFHHFETLEKAKEKYHGLLSYVYNAAVLPNIEYFCTEIIDKNGVVVKREVYNKPEPEPEEEIEEV